MKNALFALVLASSLVLSATSVEAASVSISPLSSVGVSPGTTVSFAVGTQGFTNPTYAVSDSFSGSSASSGNLDAGGYFSWTPSINDAGSHQITVTASDTLGHTATGSITITVISNSVILGTPSITGPIGVGHAVTFTVAAPSFINPAFIVSDNYPGTNISSGNISSGTFSWTPPINQQGVHGITIYSYDAYGHSGSATQTLTVTNPSLSVLSNRSAGATGTPFTFTLAANGFGNSVTYAFSDQLSTTTTFVASDIAANGNVSWTPTTADIGPHVFTITATDAAGNTASAMINFTITAAAAAPATITTTPPAASPPASSAPSSPAASAYVFTKVLTIGSTGAGVTALQNQLIALGYLKASATGYFGALTAAAVRKFQAAHGLAQVGYTGPATRAALNAGN